ncbi:MAG: hypothetical protein LAP21_27920 [Acidobacteriia bacterium]|nr:hypothetical protein [Terriglobia bacterium]
MARFSRLCLFIFWLLPGALLFPGSIIAQQAAPASSPAASADTPPQNGEARTPPGSSQPADSQPVAAGQQPPTVTQRPEHEETILKKEQSQRLFGIIPMFDVTTRRDAPPLNPSQKFRLFARSSFDPFNIAASGLDAGIGQATDNFHEYGQGAAGYGKRFGASFADSVSGGFFAGFAYPVIFREDPRYFRLGEGSFKRRAGYALSREFVCRTDRGGRSFNWSKILGAFSAGALSNVYYPNREREVGKTMTRSAISVGFGSISGLISEFWPDVERKVFHRQGETAQPSH